MIVALSTCISLFVCVNMKKGLGWTHGCAWLCKEILTGLIICTVDCTVALILVLNLWSAEGKIFMFSLEAGFQCLTSIICPLFR